MAYFLYANSYPLSIYLYQQQVPSIQKANYPIQTSLLSSTGQNQQLFHYFFLQEKENKSKSEMQLEKIKPTKKENEEKKEREQQKVKIEPNLTFSKQKIGKCLNRGKSKPTVKDEEFFSKEISKTVQRRYQKKGRNNNSNIFRAFAKLLLNDVFQKKVEDLFYKIKNKFNFSLQFNEFQGRLENELPDFTNYINNKQFRRVYFEDSQLGNCIRILFKYFIKNEAFTHILTVSYRGRIKKENVRQFMRGLHRMEESLIK